MGISRLSEFERDLKKLLKRFHSLEEDLTTFEKVLRLNPRSPQWPRISNLGLEYPEVYKVTKFACKSLKGRGAKSGIRLVFAYFPDKDLVEMVEIYFKADDEKEDRQRILARYSQCS